MGTMLESADFTNVMISEVMKIRPVKYIKPLTLSVLKQRFVVVYLLIVVAILV